MHLKTKIWTNHWYTFHLMRAIDGESDSCGIFISNKGRHAREKGIRRMKSELYEKQASTNIHNCNPQPIMPNRKKSKALTNNYWVTKTKETKVISMMMRKLCLPQYLVGK